MACTGEQSRRTQRAGLAMMMVVGVLAVASVMGFVMLSSATLQNRAGSNQHKLVNAEYLAESGINLAMYYIQYPDRAPALNASGYWPGTTSDLDLGDGATLAIMVTRSDDDPRDYEVATAVSVGSSDARITRTSGARVYLRDQFEVKRAASFNTSVQLSAYTTVNGDVWTNSNLALRYGSPLPLVTGVGYCKTSSVGGLYVSPSGGFRAAEPAAPGAPTVTLIDLYKTYKYGAGQYQCGIISGETLASGTILGPTATNPAGVYFASGLLQLESDVTINGTLVVDGVLNVRGSNTAINPHAGYPALIVTDYVDIDRTLKSLRVNGTCYVGTQIRATGTTPTAANLSTLIINGGLLVGATSGAPFPTSGYNIKTTITYDASKAQPVGLKAPSGVSILRWGLP